ncbi:hypothetical protein U1Q18_049658, partial [Sarracenia purpurea var. burkii]
TRARQEGRGDRDTVCIGSAIIHSRIKHLFQHIEYRCIPGLRCNYDDETCTVRAAATGLLHSPHRLSSPLSPIFMLVPVLIDHIGKPARFGEETTSMGRS